MMRRSDGLRPSRKLSIIRAPHDSRSTPWPNRNGVSRPPPNCRRRLTAKKVSAVELAQDAIGRIERHDGKINAVCVRDFERGAGSGPRRRRGARARRNQAAARHPHDGEGILQRRGPADDLGHSRRRRISCRPKTRCRSPASRTPAASSSARPTCRSGSATGRATTRSTAPPTTPTISAARRAALPADRRRRSRPAMARCRSAPTSAARCACRRFTAASTRTSRPSRWCHRAATRRRHCRRCRSTATSR